MIILSAALHISATPYTQNYHLKMQQKGNMALTLKPYNKMYLQLIIVSDGSKHKICNSTVICAKFNKIYWTDINPN